jgi:hypothetical protein
MRMGPAKLEITDVLCCTAYRCLLSSDVCASTERRRQGALPSADPRQGPLTGPKGSELHFHHRLLHVHGRPDCLQKYALRV